MASDDNRITCPGGCNNGSKKDKDGYLVACGRCHGVGTVRRGY